MKVEFVLRVFGGLVGGLSAYQALSGPRDFAPITQIGFGLMYFTVVVSFGLAYLVTPYLTTHPFSWVRQRIYRALATDVLASGVTRVLQTSAGRMIFARRRADPNGAYT